MWESNHQMQLTLETNIHYHVIKQSPDVVNSGNKHSLPYEKASHNTVCLRWWKRLLLEVLFDNETALSCYISDSVLILNEYHLFSFSLFFIPDLFFECTQNFSRCRVVSVHALLANTILAIIEQFRNWTIDSNQSFCFIQQIFLVLTAVNVWVKVHQSKTVQHIQLGSCVSIDFVTHKHGCGLFRFILQLF